MIDMLFKLAVVALAAGFLWVYYIDALNGRYQPLIISRPILVLDTREGIFYAPGVIQGMPPNTN